MCIIVVSDIFGRTSALENLCKALGSEVDIVLEAFKLYRERKKTDLTKLIKYGKICRIDRVMMPYLEAFV